MAKSKKVIITCAITGSIHTPTMSEHLPITAQEIADKSRWRDRRLAALVAHKRGQPGPGEQ